mmetsp:Transcript_25816/g.55563  ORF Transcript_25816/g.55563 Transcript_25816/m.55563 type:complete len:83 (+) Transcript_25816:996-1244(+)
MSSCLRGFVVAVSHTLMASPSEAEAATSSLLFADDAALRAVVEMVEMVEMVAVSFRHPWQQCSHDVLIAIIVMVMDLRWRSC